MFDFIYKMPLLISGVAIIAVLCVLSVAVLLATRRFVLPHLQLEHEHSGFIGTMVQSVMVFYGLAVALIAVSVWETHSEASSIVSHEASALASLYRDVSGYPDSIRNGLQEELRGYTEYVIKEAWPLQKQGIVAKGGVKWMNEFQVQLVSFEPHTEGQKLLHGETLRAYNHMIEARRLRLDAVQTRLSGVLWGVIFFGALISLVTTAFFRVEDVRLHGTLVALVAAFVGMIIFMILAYDRPFSGDLGVGPDSYQLVYDQLMTSSLTDLNPK